MGNKKRKNIGEYYEGERTMIEEEGVKVEKLFFGRRRQLPAILSFRAQPADEGLINFPRTALVFYPSRAFFLTIFSFSSC